MNKIDVLKELESLGESLVKCDRCKDYEIENNPAIGIIPRCINLTPRNPESFEEGIIIIGINPGRATKTEKKRYLDGLKVGKLYQYHKKYMDKHVLGLDGKEHPYHKNVKNILSLIGEDKKTILWTEIVKCQSKKDKPKLSVSTIRKCVDKYLTEELKLLENWPIFTFGNESYKTCALLFRDKAVIGFPHPSGNNRKFSKEIEQIKNKKQEIQEKIKEAINNKEAFNVREIFDKNS